MLNNIRYLIVWTVILPGVILQSYYSSYEGSVVSQCQFEAMQFAENENQYTDKNGKNAFPSFQGMQNKAEDRKAYEKEKAQRVFECISSRINETWSLNVQMTPEFQNAVFQCKSTQPMITCNPTYPYRSFDGTCNNLIVPKYGSVQSCARRLMPASYEGVSGFRKSVCGAALLPDPRFISRKLLTDVDQPSTTRTNTFVYFAQFLTHDISDLPESHVGDKIIECCANVFLQHPQCAPMYVSPDDSFYTRLNITCFNFVRVTPCASCALGKRNPMVQPTSFIDCSILYGVSDDEVRSLRTNDGTGKMTVQYREAGTLLPENYDLGFNCGSADNSEYCFKTGDRRVNQHAPLSSFQTLFLREHNRIAEKLKELNPFWNDETLFQEARKIVIAEMQVITYNEFLPLLLGYDLMTSYELNIKEDGRSNYNPLVDSTMFTEFTAAAFRIHNIVSGSVTDFGADGYKKTLTEFTRDAATLYHDQMSMMMEGMCLTASQEFNRHISKEITEPLYKKHPKTAFDLAARDIQRGRDTGVPSYTEVLRYLTNGAINIQTFNDLEQVFEHKNVELMKTVYCDPRDIDFVVGTYYELKKENMFLSWTTADIIARQFRDVKFGDRFYFEHFGNFNDDQLRSLKNVTFARILCDNSKIPYMQKNTMMFPSLSNPIMRCSDIPELNLNYWKA